MIEKIDKKVERMKTVNLFVKTSLVKKLLSIAVLFVVIGGLSGCASDTLSTPCAGYGKWCAKTPINSWDVGRS